MNNLQLLKLGELLISLKTGLNPRDNFKLNTPDAENWYITVRELNGLGINFLSQTDKVNNHGLKLINNRSNLEIGDVLFSGTGTIGKTAIVESHPTNWNIKEGVYVLKPKKDKLESYYLMYFLNHLNKLNVFNKISAGSTVFSVPMKNLEDLTIQIHSLNDQFKISNVLKSLDFKIELNNRINAELETMAKTLYDYWFVQFDFPNAKGKPYKSSGGKMVWDNELKRVIPIGWTVKNLGKVIKITRGASPRPINEYLANTGTPWVKISDATKTDNRFIIETKQFIIEDGVSGSRSVFPNSLILSNSASPAIPRIMKINACVHDGWLIIEDYSDGLTPEVMFHFFEYERPRILSLGSGSIFKNLKTEYLKDFKFINPPKLILDQITPQFKTISESIYKRTLENQKLSSLRDWLLPMLMNGQVKVN